MIARAFGEFFRDLFAGDLVAIGIVLGFLLFILILGLFGAKILWDQHRANEKHRNKLKGSLGRPKTPRE